MPDMEGLKELGPSGAFISLMASAVAGLSAAVVVQWRQANKVYGYRLAERDTLNKALTDNTNAINAMTRTTDERNRVTEELAEAINKLASAFEHVNDRLQMQHDFRKDQGDRMETVVGSLSDAVRVNTGMVTDIRNYIQQQPHRGR